MEITQEQIDKGYSKIESTAELVKRLCLAESNVRIYSVNHPSTKAAIRSAYDWLVGMIEKTGQVAISMVENKILFEGIPIEERNPIVARFAARFNQIHVDNLFFVKGLGYEEFEGFFRILGEGPKYINDHGGLLKLLKEEGITHIEIKEVSFVMITEDEKVVSRDAKVINGKLLEGLLADSEIVEYMVRKVLKKAEERKWLINEIKNNPKRMSDLISEGIELAISRKEHGMRDEETIEILLENIRLVGQAMLEEETSEEVKEGKKSLEEAIMTLESEVRARSKKLMSSKVAIGFINEILGMITSFSDRIKAKRISDEFLKGEKGLKQAENLLRSFTPKGDTSEKFLLRIRDLLMERGVGEEELIKLLNKVKRKKKERKPYFNKAILEGITKRLEELRLEDSQLKEVAERLTTFFNNKLNERAKEFKIKTQYLAEALIRRDLLLEGLNRGLLIWNPEGVIEFMDGSAREILALKKGDRIRWALLTSLKTLEFPMTVLPEELSSEKGWAEQDKRLLLSIEKTIKDEHGEVIGALLRR